MDRLSTLRSTISAAVIATMLAGCASSGGQTSNNRHFGGRSNSDLGLATRALAALAANRVDEAISLAERAVEKTPGDAGFRTLLGNAYFAGGRFASAEQAYKDALSLYSGQPQTVLKLALVQIALGKNDLALANLAAGRGLLDQSDYGLALALAGQANEAVAVLDQAARGSQADSRIRQNLALAYALSGDWQQARIIASQDVPARELETRLQQWMALTNPAAASDQVAALLGVSPALSDPGQPVRLALVTAGDSRLAEAAPVAVPQPVPAPVPVAELAPVTFPEPLAPVALPVAVLAVEPAPAPQLALVEVPAEPAFTAAVPPPPPPPNPLRVAASSPAEVRLALAAVARTMLPKAKAAVARNRVAAKAPMVRASAPRASGKSSSVVQLGAYRSARRVEAAWTSAARKYAALRNYQPTSAPFSSAGGLVYRLSVRGFENRAEATRLCSSLKRSGGGCFVRTLAGDRPIQFASR
ncbi:MAG: tetratricopeptide repeat protein [Sphingomicrobium sp.]